MPPAQDTPDEPTALYRDVVAYTHATRELSTLIERFAGPPRSIVAAPCYNGFTLHSAGPYAIYSHTGGGGALLFAEAESETTVCLTPEVPILGFAVCFSWAHPSESLRLRACDADGNRLLGCRVPEGFFGFTSVRPIVSVEFMADPAESHSYFGRVFGLTDVRISRSVLAREESYGFPVKPRNEKSFELC